MSDIAHIRYAELWASLWQKNSPHDRITFLIYDGDRVESQDVISLPRGYLWQKKIAHHGHGPSRVISFSRLPPLDMSIPTITHVPDMVDVFYPRYTQNYIRRRYDGYTFRKNLKLSRYLIVPHRGIERDIVDMYGISEEKISIIPSLIEVQGENRGSFLFGEGQKYKNVILTEGTSGNEWNPLELLHAYSRYVHEMGGMRKLLIHGDMGENLGHMTSMIRSFDLIEHVRLVGILTKPEYDLLYTQAGTWIYAGSYYSGGYTLGKAIGYGLPLILSDIEGLQAQNATYVHPNHLEELPALLAQSLTHFETVPHHVKNMQILEAYKRIIAL